MLSLIAVALLQISEPAPAAPAPPAAETEAAAPAEAAPASQPTEAAPPAEPRVECHRETPTGSHRPIRVCRTIEQSEEDTRVSRDAMREIQNRRSAHQGGFSAN